MEDRRHVEFTGVELATSVKKAMVGPVEKATAGERHGGEGGRRSAVIWRGGDAA
jgi:hypothetical protein